MYHKTQVVGTHKKEVPQHFLMNAYNLCFMRKQVEQSPSYHEIPSVIIQSTVICLFLSEVVLLLLSASGVLLGPDSREK